MLALLSDFCSVENEKHTYNTELSKVKSAKYIIKYDV